MFRLPKNLAIRTDRRCHKIGNGLDQIISIGKFCNEDLFRSYSNVLNSRFLKPATLQKMFILNFYLRNYHQGQCLETNDASRLLGNCPYESNVSWIFASWLQQAQIKPLVQTVDCVHFIPRYLLTTWIIYKGRTWDPYMSTSHNLEPIE